MEYGHLAGINYESAADGTGVRTSIFFSGCRHACPGCHNPETHDPLFGIPITKDIIRQIAEEIKARPYLSGITLTGGDPFYEPQQTINFLDTLRYFLGYLPNIWAYTGYTMKQIQDRSTYPDDFIIKCQALAAMCDVIVDGPFIRDLADKCLAFRGSSNQNIIYVR